jgi:hypothetical protein
MFAFAGTDEPTISNAPAVWPQYYNGTNFKHPRIDRRTRDAVNIDVSHHKIHEGDSYFVSGTTVIGSGLTQCMIFQVPVTTKTPHLSLSLASTGIANFYLMENGDPKTVATNLISGGTPYNHDRNSANASGCTVQFVQNWSKWGTGKFPGGTTLYSLSVGTNGLGNTTIGGAAERENEIILRSGTTYVLMFYSGAAANNISYNLNWYEHTPLTE